jgi:hypothetical protein
VPVRRAEAQTQESLEILKRWCLTSAVEAQKFEEKDDAMDIGQLERRNRKAARFENDYRPDGTYDCFKPGESAVIGRLPQLRVSSSLTQHRFHRPCARCT